MRLNHGGMHIFTFPFFVFNC
uniref:Uncharacterized protein n=1 Tax=Anguilla anguilla TaxID=7936 RepID=A0A0E9UJD2_ANGAN